MKFFEPLALSDVCLLAFAVIMILLVCNDQTLRKDRRTLVSGVVCIVVGLLSVATKMAPALSPLVMLMIGAFSLRLGLRLRLQARTARQPQDKRTSDEVIDAEFVLIGKPHLPPPG
jgi:hypothetical protein